MILIFLLLFSLQVSAGFKKYVVNNQHSYINFEIPFMSVSKVRGTFSSIDADFEFDEANQKIGKLIAKVSVTKINTGDSRRDNHLRSNDFFHIAKYPYFVFEAKSFEYNSKGEVQKVTGDVNIKGVSKKVTWNINYRGKKTDDKGFESLFFVANGNLSRKDFNLNWNKTLDQGEYVVGDEINFEMVIEAHPFGKVPQFSRFFALNQKEREDSRSLIEGQNVLLTSLEVNSTLHKEIQDLKTTISSKERLLSFYQDEINRHKFEREKLQKEIKELKAPPMPLKKRIIILIISTIVLVVVSLLIIKHKVKTDDGDIFDYLKPTKTKWNAVLDGIFVFTIFSYAWMIFSIF